MEQCFLLRLCYNKQHLQATSNQSSQGRQGQIAETVYTIKQFLCVRDEQI